MIYRLTLTKNQLLALITQLSDKNSTYYDLLKYKSLNDEQSNNKTKNIMDISVNDLLNLVNKHNEVLDAYIPIPKEENNE